MPHRTCHTEVSNKERNVKTHDGDDGRQVIQSKTVVVAKSSDVLNDRIVLQLAR